MKNYKCGPFVYTFPDSCCVFCKHSDIFWDYTHGIYTVWCDRGNQIDSLGKLAQGCNEIERDEDE